MRIARLLLVLALAMVPAFAGTLFFEDFEGDDVVNIQSQTSGVLVGTQFRIVSGSVDVITPIDSYTVMCSAPLSGNCIDTVGGGRQGLGVIESIDPIDFAPGDYVISFDLIGWFYSTSQLSQTATVEASIGSLWSDTYVRVGSNNPYPTVTAYFTVDSATSERIRFTTLAGSGFAGAILDNVKITTVGEGDEETVPEPGTFALFGSALVGLGLLRRFKQTRN